MYLPFRQRRGLSTSTGMPSINDAHPLRGLLSSAIVFNNTSTWDLCGILGRGSLAYGTITAMNGVVGRYLRVQDAGLSMQATLSGNFTIVVMAMRATTPPGSGVHGVAGLISTIYLATAQRGIAMDMGNRYGDVNKLYMYHYTSPGVGFNAASAWVDGVKQSGTNPCDITISNGKWYGISAAYTGVAAGTGNLTFGGLADGANYMEDGAVALCCVFRGVLPETAMRDLSFDPGQMIIWPDDQMFFSSGVSALTPSVIRTRPFIFRRQ